MALTARDVMKAAVVKVTPDLSLADLEDLLISKRISGAPVVDKGNLVGIVSRSDVVRTLSLDRSLAGIVADGLAPGHWSPEREGPRISSDTPLAESMKARTVGDAMVRDVVTVTPETPLADVARKMIARHLHRVLVCEGSKLLGVISSLDVVATVADGRAHDA